MRPRIYKNAAEKLRVWRQRQKERRAYALRMWILPPKERAHLLRDVPWLRALSREAEELRGRLNEAERYATIGRSAEAEINTLLDRVATLEQRERRREQNRDRKRRRREGGILLPSDPAAIRDHYAQDTLSPFAQTAPTTGPRIGQDRNTIGPRIGQDLPRIGTGFTQDPPNITPAAPRPAQAPYGAHDGAGADGHDGRDWLRYISIPRAPIQPVAFSGSQRRPAPAPAGNKSAALLEKIKAAGYGSAIRGDKVLYGGTELLTPEEWLKRMPGIVD